MTNLELLELLGNVSDSYVADAQTPIAKRLSFRRPLLVAALVVLMLLLVGCTVAYVNGWFTNFFAARSEDPLSLEQVEFIQEHEQIIQETQEKGGWTVELKSAICDSGTGYILFGITAPENVDLEGYHAGNYGEAYITPGNNSINNQHSRAMIVASTGFADEEKNFVWQGGGGQGGWQEDNDGKANTMNYLLGTRPEKIHPDRKMLLEDPFGPDVTFTVRFDGFTLEYEDLEIRKKIDEKYAGMTDYMVDTEDLVGLNKSETLSDENWEFTVVFDVEKQADTSVELITGEPITTWANVWWRLQADNPMGYEIGNGIAAVKITSFVLNPFGASLTYEFFEDAANGAFIEYQNFRGYTDRYVYAVMKDGTQIALHTDGTGDKLTAESPIVLSEVDHILLGDTAYIQRGDGVKIPMPE